MLDQISFPSTWFSIFRREVKEHLDKKRRLKKKSLQKYIPNLFKLIINKKNIPCCNFNCNSQASSSLVHIKKITRLSFTSDQRWSEDAREREIEIGYFPVSKSFQRTSISLSPANTSHAVVSRRVHTFQSLNTFRDFRNLSTGYPGSGQSEILPEIQFRSDDSYGSRAIVTPWCRLSSLCSHPLAPDSTIGGWRNDGRNATKHQSVLTFLHVCSS